MIVYKGQEAQTVLYEALARLSADKDFATVLRWFEDSEADLKDTNVTAVDTPEKKTLSWNQGRCMTIREFLREARNWKEVLDKLRKQ